MGRSRLATDPVIVARGYSTPADVDAADATRDRLIARARAAAAGLALLVAGTHPELIKEAEAERDRLAAKADLLDAGTRPEAIETARAGVVELKALVEELRTQQAECIVSSPSKAFVEVVAARPGGPPRRPDRRPGPPRRRPLGPRGCPRDRAGADPPRQQGRRGLRFLPGQDLRGRGLPGRHDERCTPRNVQSRDERRHQVFGIKVRIDDLEGVFKSGMAAEVSVPLDEARLTVATLRSPKQ